MCVVVLHWPAVRWWCDREGLLLVSSSSWVTLRCYDWRATLGVAPAASAPTQTPLPRVQWHAPPPPHPHGTCALGPRPLVPLADRACGSIREQGCH